MALLSFKKNTGLSLGIEFGETGIALVVQAKYASKNAVVAVGFINAEDSLVACTESQVLIERFIDQHKLKGCACHIVLAAKDYQILLAEAPDVPDDELRDAIRWRVKDLLSQGVEQTALDTFRLPKDGMKGGKSMAYVVAAESQLIRKLIDFVADLNLDLRSIDIGEMALRNISLLLDAGKPEGRGVGIVRIRENGGTVALYRAGNLYLSRQFRMNYKGGLLDELPEDELALEIQRSLDYYERQMGLSLPAAIYVCGENISSDKINDRLKRALALPIDVLDTSRLALDIEVTDSGIMQQCIAALGASIRDEVAA